MSDNIIYVRSDSKWRTFCFNYLIRKGFCVQCEESGKLNRATVVHQPTPDEDNKKEKYSHYNLRPLCADCGFNLPGRTTRISAELLPD